jgi:hypothetical protein
MRYPPERTVMNKRDAVVIGTSVVVTASVVDAFQRFRKHKKNLRQKAAAKQLCQALAVLRAVLVAQEKTLMRIHEGRYKTIEELKTDFDFEIIAELEK